MPPAEELSRGELRVLRYLPTNLSRPEITSELSVSVNTVNTEVRSIYAKLQVRDRSSAGAASAGTAVAGGRHQNLTAAGEGSVERGTETYNVSVRELSGADRDRIYAEQARRYPGFAEYERQTAGVRTIPVLDLRRA